MALRKGDAALIFNNGLVIQAILIDLLSPTKALARAMEGACAGEEVEADFPVGRLESPSSFYNRPDLVPPVMQARN